MQKNMGVIDRSLRTIIALVVFGFIYFGVLSGTWAWVLGAFSVVFLLTSLVSFCPLYRIIGVKTCSTE